MADSKVCSSCKSDMVECSFESVPIFVKSPNQKLYESKSTVIVPYVCKNCGRVEFFAKSPDKLI